MKALKDLVPILKANSKCRNVLDIAPIWADSVCAMASDRLPNISGSTDQAEETVAA
jgi:hypothetical protein